MLKIKQILLFTLFFSIFCCQRNTVRTYTSDINENSKKKSDIYSLEKDLIVLKNITFINYLGELESLTYNKYGLEKRDSCFMKYNIKDASIHQYINASNINLNYLFNDINRKKLIEKWIHKDFDLISIEGGDELKHSFNNFKALEFYNSNDLKSYIDSVRTIELEKLKK